jgi:amino acid permease
MNELPWGVIIGLSIVLLGTIWCIAYILRIDSIEEKTKNDRH